MEKKIIHIDVNNAFLSWTAVDQLKKGETLDIRTIPAIIGGDEATRHGIVLAKSTPAKQFGIKTAEPIYFARKKCPELRSYSSDFSVYYKYSEQLYQLLLTYTNQVERFSIDECFLDVTKLCKNRETLVEIAYELNKTVKEKFGFTVNIGVSSNKLLAKMASDFEKPDKVHTLFLEEIEEKMWKLPVSELFMVGKKTIPKLEKFQIKTIGDLAKANQELLINLFGKYGKTIWEYANGIGPSTVEYEEQSPKGIGHSITLSEDIEEIQTLNQILYTLTEQVGFRLRNCHKKAYVVNVQIKTKDFQMYSHQKKLEKQTNSTKIIFEVGKELLEKLYQNRAVRLIGIRVDQLVDEKEIQLSIFDTKQEEKQEKLDQTMDHLKQKYGKDVVTRATNMNQKKKKN